MPRIRRARYVFLYLEDELVADAAVLLGGGPGRVSQDARVLALIIPTGQREVITREELALLLSVPTGLWVDEATGDPRIVRSLLQKGLLLSDSAEPELRHIRERDDALSGVEWNPYAALYHYMTRWAGVELFATDIDEMHILEGSRAEAKAFVAEHGQPPEMFVDDSARTQLPLPGGERHEGLWRLLLERRTTRGFDLDSPMTLEQFDTVLRYAFGCHGYGRTVGDTILIKRTSPSGGGLHPVEAYPIVTSVEGIPPGIYHYNAGDHSLALIEELDSEESERLGTSFMCGQSYFGSAHVKFALTARFYRSYWKYRRHPKAYAGLLMDAAHLSQTLYLVSGELGLGAFITIAVNGRDIEERLGLDGVDEGVIAVLGCGPRAPSGSELELRYSPTPPG